MYVLFQLRFFSLDIFSLFIRFFQSFQTIETLFSIHSGSFEWAFNFNLGSSFYYTSNDDFFGYFCCCIVVCTLIQWPTLIQYSSLCFCLFSVFEYILKAVVCWCRLLLLLFQIFGSLHLWLVELNCTICLNNERVIKPVWHKWFVFSWKCAYTYRTSECRVN